MRKLILLVNRMKLGEVKANGHKYYNCAVWTKFIKIHLFPHQSHLYKINIMGTR